MNNDDMQALVSRVAEAIRAEVRDELAAVIDRIETDHAAAVEAGRADARDTHHRLTASVKEKIDSLDAVVLEVRKEAASVVKAAAAEVAKAVNASLGDLVADAGERVSAAVSTAAEVGVAGITQRTDQARAAIEAMEQRAGQAVDEHVARYDEIAEQARQLAIEVATAAAKADAAKADADRRVAEAEKAEAEAERATAVLTKIADHEVNRATEEMHFKAREKATLAALQREREQMDDRFDLEQVELQRAVNKYYPTLRKRLDEVAAKATEQDDQEDEE